MVEMELNILSEEKIKVIISRAKAKWQVAGGKEYSFCNLEKKHFTEKNYQN